MGTRKGYLVNAEFEYGVTAAFLDSGRSLASVANAGAIVAGIGSIMAGPTYGRIAFAVSILCWAVECWFAVRVRIDGALFRVLCANENSGRRLDEKLLSLGFACEPKERSASDRTRGAMKLWRKQVAAGLLQVATLAAGIALRLVDI